MIDESGWTYPIFLVKQNYIIYGPYTGADSFGNFNLVCFFYIRVGFHGSVLQVHLPKKEYNK